MSFSSRRRFYTEQRAFGREIESGVKPVGRWLRRVVISSIVVLIPLGLFGRGCSLVSGWLGQAQNIATKEFGPQKQFEHYQWFKDASATLEARLATLTMYKGRFKDLEAAYEGKPRSEWAKEDRTQWSLWKSECSGIAGSYNQLASEYNAAMAKINWRYANIGDLPRGATNPLPREFKPYLEQ